MTKYPSPLFVSVQSQKGGVGKTSVALHLAKLLLDDHTVLFFDLDLTGTESAVVAKVLAGEDFWKESLHVVPASWSKAKKDEKINLASLFSRYMAGEVMPEATFVPADKANAVGGNFLRLREGNVNVISSHLSRFDKDGSDNGHDYGPSVLFDSLHAEWFLEMVKEIVLSCRKKIPGKLAVVFDNAPGYCGLEPVLEEWLTDLGPTCAKFLFVTSPDSQDRDATAKAMKRVEELHADKEKAADFLHKGEKGFLTKRQKEVFLRLIEAAPDDYKKCALPKPDKTVHGNCTDCDLCYYLGNTNTLNVTSLVPFIRALVNKMPPELFHLELKTNRKNVKTDAPEETSGNGNAMFSDLCLTGQSTIPVLDDLIFQFCCDEVEIMDDDPEIVKLNKEKIAAVEWIENIKNGIRGDISIYISSIKTASGRLKLKQDFTVEDLMKFKERVDEVCNKIVSQWLIGSSSFTAVDPFGTTRFISLTLFPIGLKTPDVSASFYYQFCRNHASSLGEKNFAAITKHFKRVKGIPNISDRDMRLETIVFSLSLGRDKASQEILEISGQCIALAVVLDEQLGWSCKGEGEAYTLPKRDKIQSIIRHLGIQNIFSNVFKAIEDIEKFYLTFCELRLSFLEITDDIDFVFDSLQTLVGTPKHRAIYGQAILALIRDVVETRKTSHKLGRIYLDEFGMPIVDPCTGTMKLVSGRFDRFKQGRSFTEFSKRLIPIKEKWMNTEIVASPSESLAPTLTSASSPGRAAKKPSKTPARS